MVFVQKKQTTGDRTNKKRHLLILLILTLAALTIFCLVWTSVIRLGRPPETASPYTKGQPSLPPSTNSSPSSHQQPGDQKSTSGNSTGQTLLAPEGVFVSNHHPNLSGSPAPSTLNSTCSTTPGATCKITFTMGSVVKSLSAQTTDRGGSAYWNWKLQDVGLTAGSWQVQAVAHLNGQTKTTTDALLLEVSP